jgi:hypothetical protein
MCVAISRGSPTLNSRAAPMIMASMGCATSSCRQSRRSAEQRWPAERKAEAMTSSLTCSGKRGGIHDHGIDAAGLGDQRHDGAILGGERAVDGPSHRGRAGEGHARHMPMRDEPRADGAVARHELQGGLGDAGFMQEPNRLIGHQRRLFGGLGDDAIARRQRRHHLAAKNGQGESSTG